MAKSKDDIKYDVHRRSYQKTNHSELHTKLAHHPNPINLFSTAQNIFNEQQQNEGVVAELKHFDLFFGAGGKRKTQLQEKSTEEIEFFEPGKPRDLRKLSVASLGPRVSRTYEVHMVGAEIGGEERKVVKIIVDDMHSCLQGQGLQLQNRHIRQALSSTTTDHFNQTLHKIFAQILDSNRCTHIDFIVCVFLASAVVGSTENLSVCVVDL
ncbi:hypothetical protein L6452_40658 [Arctium lappa]|uniref:Uncharacterized protein n=1 Tax=Arctium lappa TaxID=4217 RepID=A0ACB8XP89_ARCLA|nr:hypothetical protein L6452_40658 [Arctium lappa]